MFGIFQRVRSLQPSKRSHMWYILKSLTWKLTWTFRLLPLLWHVPPDIIATGVLTYLFRLINGCANGGTVLDLLLLPFSPVSSLIFWMKRPPTWLENFWKTLHSYTRTSITWIAKMHSARSSLLTSSLLPIVITPEVSSMSLPSKWSILQRVGL